MGNGGGRGGRCTNPQGFAMVAFRLAKMAENDVFPKETV